MTNPGDPTVGELSRQVRDVLIRFNDLARNLETQFLRNDNFALYKQLVDQALGNLQEAGRTAARIDDLKDLEDDVARKANVDAFATLQARVEELEDDKKWITRLILGVIILAVVGTVLAVSKTGTG